MTSIDEKRQQVVATTGHTLVTGGPGSGKTTISLLKALKRIEDGLGGGQSVLFLSFSRAAVARTIEAAKREIPAAYLALLNIQTFHSFFWEILRTHGYLLGVPRRLALLAPHDEKALSAGLERSDPGWNEWEAERQRLCREEGRVAFDLFAPMAAQLLSSSRRLRKLVAARYPLIIVDEAQDTGPEQWACIKMIAEHTQVVCLADLDQQIFDFLPGVGPERIKEIEADLNPTRIDFGRQNSRSPNSEINAFGDDILAGKSRGKPYDGVTIRFFNPKAELRDKAIRQSVGIVNKLVYQKTGSSPDSIALLASYDKGVTIISNALRNGPTPIAHKVLFDEAVTLLASRFIAFLMEPKSPDTEAEDLATALELLSSYFRAHGTLGAFNRSEALRSWADETRGGKVPTRARLYAKLQAIIRQLQGFVFTGVPGKDWLAARGMLTASADSELTSLEEAARYLMTFNRGKRIEAGLATVWVEKGNYAGARGILDQALAQDQIYAGGEDLSGIHVMNMHKSKGKQFDAVIVFRDGHSSPFVWPNDPPPHRKSRKLLRVAITRARVQVLILSEPYSPCPILAPHKLSP